MATTMIDSPSEIDLSSLNENQYRIVREFVQCIKDVKVFDAEEIGNILATMEILMDDGLRTSLEAGIKDIQAGRVSDWNL